MSMKRTLSGFLALIMVLLLVPVVGVNAADQLTITLDVPATAEVGDEITASVSVPSGFVLSSCRVMVVFDDTQLEVVDAKMGAFLNGFSGSINKNYNKNGVRGVRASFAGAENTTNAGGVLMTVTFKVLAAGEIKVATSDCNFYDGQENAEKYTYTDVEKTITVAGAQVSETETTQSQPQSESSKAPFDGDFEIILEAPATANVGEEFTVSVKVPAGFVLSSCRVMVVFDETKLQVVDAKMGAFLNGFSGSINKDYNKNGVRGVRASFAGAENTTNAGGELMSVTFKAIAAGAVKVATSDCNFYDGQENAEKYAYGDVEKTITVAGTQVSETETTVADTEPSDVPFEGDFEVIMEAPASVKVGEEFTVSVKVPAGFVISSCRVMVVFDETKLQVVDAKMGAFLNGFSGSINKDYSKNGVRGVRASFAGAENTTNAGGEVMSVTFKAIAEGSTKVATSDCNFYDGQENAEKYAYGDVEKAIAINAGGQVSETETTVADTEPSDVPFEGDFEVILEAPASVKVGEEFTVSVKVPAGFVISSCRVMVVFDETKLQVVDAKMGAFLNGFSGSINKDYSKNGVRGVRASFAGAENTTNAGGEVMSVTFKAIAEGSTKVATSDCNFYDGQENAEKYAYGDVEKAIAINAGGQVSETETTVADTEPSDVPFEGDFEVILEAPTSVKVGEEFTVSVKVPAGFVISSCRVMVVFDETKLQVVDAKMGAFLNGFSGSINKDYSKNGVRGVRASFAGAENTTNAGGEVMSVTFKAIAEGSTKVATSDCNFYDGQENAEKYAYGDVEKAIAINADDVTTSTSDAVVSEKLELKDGVAAVLTDKYVYISKEEMTADAVIALFKNEGVVIAGKTSSDITSTGAKVQLIVNGNVVDQVEVVLLGDIDGDGVITVTDILFIKKALLRLYDLQGVEFAAADIDRNDIIDTTDYANVRLYFLHLVTIEEWLKIVPNTTETSESTTTTTEVVTEPSEPTFEGDFEVIMEAPASVNVGEEFTVSVKVPAGFVLSSCRVMVVFDATQLEVVDAKMGAFLNGFSGSINKDYNKNGVRGVRASFAGSENTSDVGGVVMTVTFKAIAAGAVKVATSDCNFYDGQEAAEKYVYGDVEKTVTVIGDTDVSETETTVTETTVTETSAPTTTTEAVTEPSEPTFEGDFEVIMEAPASVNVGEEFTVSVKVPAGFVLSSCRVMVVFDATQLEVVAAKMGAFLNGFSGSINKDYNKNGVRGVRASFAGSENTSDVGGELMTVTFKAIAAGAVKVATSDCNFYDGQENAEKYVYGDVEKTVTVIGDTDVSETETTVTETEATVPSEPSFDGDFEVIMEAPATANVGDEITVTVKVPAGFVLSSCRVMVAFDETQLEVVDAKMGSFLNGFSGSINKNYNKNGVRGVRASFAGAENTSDVGGELMTVTFKVLAAGEVKVSTSDCNFYDGQENAEKYVYGDAVKTIVVG